MRVRAYLALSVLLAAGCSSSGDDGSTDAAPQAPRLCDRFSDQRIAVGGSFRFLADEKCTFALEGAGASVTDDGLFRAPSTEGSFKVRITSAAVPSRSKTVTVTVSAPTLQLVAGAFGGNGWSDGPADEAAFNGVSCVALRGDSVFIGERNHIRKLDRKTNTVSTLASFGSAIASRLVNTIAVTDDGAVYFTIDGSRAIWSVAPGATGATVLAGDDTTFGTADGDFASARFSGFLFLTTDGKQTLWVADSDNKLLRRLDLTTRKVTTVAGSTASDDAVDGIGTSAGFFQSHAIGWDPAGCVWIAEGRSTPLRRFDPVTAEVKTIAKGFAAIVQSVVPDGKGSVYVGDPLGISRVDVASKVSTRFSDTFGVRFALDGDQLIGGAEGAVSRFVLASKELVRIAGRDEPKDWVDGTVGTRFNGPSDLAFVNGLLYVADTQNGWVRLFDPSSKEVSSRISTRCPQALIDDRRGGLFITGCDQPSRVDLTTRDAETLKTAPVEVAPDGTRFYADPQPDGTVRIFAEGTDGVRTAVAGGYAYLGGVVADGFGHLFISDTKNGTIHRVDLATRKDEIVAGQSSSFGYVDGGPGVSRLTGATGLVYDGRGGLFFADGELSFLSNTIRKMDTVTGEVTTVIGRYDRPAHREGALPSQVMGARGLAVGADGELYFLQHGALMHVSTPL